MTTVQLNSPVNILVVLGLTLPDISDEQIQMIQAAAPAGSTVTVVASVRDAVTKAAELKVDVILGMITEKLYAVTPALRWLHGTASGVDSFLFPAFRDSDVALTGEKGLVGDTSPIPVLACCSPLHVRSRPRSGSDPTAGIIGKRCVGRKLNSRA